MAKEIPTQVARENVNAGPSGAFGSAEPSCGAREGTILGGGLNQVASGLSRVAGVLAENQRYADEQNARQQELISRQLEKQKAQDEALEVNQKYSQLRTDWTNHLREWQENPSEEQFTVAQKEYDDYTNKLLAGTSSPNVSNELKLHASQFRIHLLDSAYRIQSATRQKNFGSAFIS